MPKKNKSSIMEWTGRLVLAAVLAGPLLMPVSAQAYFQDLGMGVRPVGMGEAFVAVADDSNTMFYNVGGLAGLTRREINLMYSDLFSNLGGRLYDGTTDTLGFHNVGVVVPIDQTVGTFGFTWTLFNSRFYREDSFVLGYGREIGAPLFDLLEIREIMKGFTLGAGMNLKVLNWQVTANEYTATNTVFSDNGLSRAAFTADVGLLLIAPDNLRFGLSLENFIPANAGLTVYETVPINFRLGAAYLYDWKGKINYLDSFLGALDFTQRNGVSDVRLGGEFSFFERLFQLRLGTSVDQFTTGLSLNAPISGMPVDWRLDYAFTYPYQIQSTLGSHRISLVVLWGGKSMPLIEKTESLTQELPAEENLAAKRDAELAAEREKEQAKLKAMMDQLRLEIQAARTALNRVNELIKLGKLPTIQFQSGKAMLTRKSFESLDQIGSILAKFPQIKVRLEGHTDSTGSEKVNQRLSQNRVEAVKEYLAGKYKLVPSNLIPVGYGETRPIASNTTPEGRAVNRRVEVVVLVPAGMDVGGADGKDLGADAGENLQEQINPDDIVKYEDVEKLRERLNIYKMQMNQGEVEEMFNQQHQPESK